jgi:hypothetical protein
MHLDPFEIVKISLHPDLSGFIDHSDAEIFCVKARAFLLLNGLSEAHYHMR